MKIVAAIVLVSLFLFSNSFSNSSLPNCKGKDYSNWTNCYGEFTDQYDEKFKYTYKGEFGKVPGKWEGLGIYFLIDKNGKEVVRYEGQVSNGREFGFGVYTESDGLKQITQKDKNGIGFSKTYYPEGDIYIGQTKRGTRHGKGVQTTKGKKKIEIYAMFENDHGIELIISTTRRSANDVLFIIIQVLTFGLHFLQQSFVETIHLLRISFFAPFRII